MNKENCALRLVDEIILYYDARSKKHQITTNVEHEVYDYTGNNWSHRNSNELIKEKFGRRTRKTFNIFTTKTAVLGTSHIIRKVL